MTIEDPSIPLTDFPIDAAASNEEVSNQENLDLPIQKSYSLPNLFQSISNFSKRFSKPSKISNKQLNIELAFFLYHQRKRVRDYTDINDIQELERCTKDMELSLSHIKFSPTVKKYFADFYKTMTEKEYELKYRHIFSNLDETLCVFSDDFMSRNLRREIHRMLYNANDRTRIVDIFFFGKYPLDERYLSRKFSKEVYTAEGKKRLLKEIDNYLDGLCATISKLMDISECLKQYIIFPKEQVDAIGRLEAMTSVLKRPLPMMQNLKISLHLPLPPLEEKIQKKFEDKQKEKPNWIIEDLPEIENLDDFLGNLT